MFHVILWQPEIPPNTGNIIRLCANTGATLSLVGPLGFKLDEPRLRRAGLDYHEFATVQEFADLDDCLAACGHPRLWTFSAHGRRNYAAARYAPGDALLFGQETRGLPQDITVRVPAEQRLAIPMRPGNRSLNLSNAVAVAVYEAWRQQDFESAGDFVSRLARTPT
jgi:tRNA (cytidine/uridine-2'-O-)-methyltransferase